jgi:hypothetical protein
MIHAFRRIGRGLGRYALMVGPDKWGPCNRRVCRAAKFAE